MSMSDLLKAIGDFSSLGEPQDRKRPPSPAHINKRTPTIPPECFAMTEEQDLVVNSRARRIKIKAFAGSGKTTLLERLTRIRSQEKWLYIAFNATVRDEATLRFHHLVDCKTSHGLAFPKYGAPLKEKLDIPVSSQQVCYASKIGIEKSIESLYGKILIHTLNNFIASPEDGITALHLPVKELDLLKSVHDGFMDNDAMLRDTEKVWIAMLDTKNHKIGVSHDAYLKLFQLSGTILPYDGILLDEGQDSNQALLRIFTQHTGNQVIVGDPHQSIYSFRGSVDAMSSVECDQDFSLTQSFRFGSEIADFANTLLVMKGEKERIIGNGTLGSVGTKMGFSQSSTAIISRTNASLFKEAARYAENNQKIFIAGGLVDARFDLLRDLSVMMYGGTPNDGLLSSFVSYESFKATAQENDDIEWLMRCKIVEEFGRNLVHRLESITKNMVPTMDQAQRVFATAHKSKGLQFDNVILSDDFIGAQASKGDHNRVTTLSEIEETNILYVAASRAKHRLVIQPEQYDFWRKVSPMINKNATENEKRINQGYWSDTMKNYFKKM